MLWTEAVLVLCSLFVALVSPDLGSNWFGRMERHFSRLSRHRVLCIVSIGALALALRAALLPIEPIPQPTIPDEFSYLLMSDTFAHGRLTNPTHPMSIHFKASGVNQEPTYISKYFPGHGVLLALGQLALGHPFWGVWFGMGIMAAAICWMLQGWFPPLWALLGALLAVIRLGTFSYWANSYFGGTIAAIGGALVLGALPRIKRRERVFDGLLFGLGLALLASSRPFEGLIFSLPIVTTILVWTWKRYRSGFSGTVSRVLLPSALVLAACFSAMLYYFWQATGSPFRTPYQVNLHTQDPVPIFPWQPLSALSETDVRTVFVNGEIDQYQFVRSHFVISSISRIIQFYLFFLGPALSLPFLLAAFTVRRHLANVKILLVVLLVSAFGLLLPVYYGPSYAAALSCVVYALLIVAMQRLRKWSWRGKYSGLVIVRSVPIICLLMFVIRVVVPLPGISTPPMVPLTWSSPHLFENLNRGPIESVIQSKPGLHIALVRYPHDQQAPVDWVENLADIDQQRVIWANDLGEQLNQELIQYYKNRQVWLVEPDKSPAQIMPYPGDKKTIDDVPRISGTGYEGLKP